MPDGDGLEHEQQTTEEEINDDDAKLSELIERINALATRIGDIEIALSTFTAQLGGYDGRFQEFDARIRREEPSERHWYFKRLNSEVQ